jgi:hypothetical protein
MLQSLQAMGLCINLFFGLPMSSVHRLFSLPVTKPTQSNVVFWFCLSLAFTGMVGILALQRAFAGDYVVQDDARQHVFWMQRFLDPGLFPNDLIANYFQSVAPWGFANLYRGAAMLGINPFLFSKLLPPVIWLVSTAYCFGATMQVFPVPIAGFLSSAILLLSTIQADDIPSATPRAFAYPLFLAFLYYLMKRSPVPCWISLGLQGLFYPQIMLLSCAMLGLQLVQRGDLSLKPQRFQHHQGFQQWRFQLTRDRPTWLLSVVGLVVGAVFVGLYLAGGANEYGPVITASQARTMPEFQQFARGEFFLPNPLDYWIIGNRSGLLPRLSRLLKPLLIVAGFCLPWLIVRPVRFPLAAQVTQHTRELVDTLIASMVLFFAAHAVLFKLHHPSRYTQHTFRIVGAIAAGVAIVLLLDALFRWARQHSDWRKTLTAWLTAVLIASWIAVYPISESWFEKVPVLEAIFPNSVIPGYLNGQDKAMYQFFAQQPKDIMIASLAREANSIPSFSLRSILVGWEYGIPYHLGYYQQIRDRVLALIRAHYSSDIAQVQEFTQKYGITYWIVARDSFTPRFINRLWAGQFKPETDAAIAALTASQSATNNAADRKPLIVQEAMQRCAVVSTEKLVVMSANCVIKRGNL